jgi:hypothetical protein
VLPIIKSVRRVVRSFMWRVRWEQILNRKPVRKIQINVCIAVRINSSKKLGLGECLVNPMEDKNSVIWMGVIYAGSDNFDFWWFHWL